MRESATSQANALKDQVLRVLANVDQQIGGRIPTRFRRPEGQGFYRHNASIVDVNGNIIERYKDLSQMDIEALCSGISVPVIVISEGTSDKLGVNSNWTSAIGDPREVLWNQSIGFSIIVPNGMVEDAGVYTYDPASDRRFNTGSDSTEERAGDFVVKTMGRAGMSILLGEES